LGRAVGNRLPRHASAGAGLAGGCYDNATPRCAAWWDGRSGGCDRLAGTGDRARHQRTEAGDRLDRRYAGAEGRRGSAGAIDHRPFGWSFESHGVSGRHFSARFRDFRCGLCRRRRHVSYRRSLFSEQGAGAQFLRGGPLWFDCRRAVFVDPLRRRASIVGRRRRAVQCQTADGNQQRYSDGRVVHPGGQQPGNL